MFQSLDQEDLQLSVLYIVNTWWLSLSNVISNLHQIIFLIIDAFNDDAINNTYNYRCPPKPFQNNFVIPITMFLI